MNTEDRGLTNHVAKSKEMMKLIELGMHEFTNDLLGNKLTYRILDNDEALDIVRSTSGYDMAAKFPLVKTETLIRALTKVNGDKLPSIADARNFIGKLHPTIVDMMFISYEQEKKAFELHLEEMMVDLKNSSRSQTQEGTGHGQNSSDLSGSVDSTQSNQ